MEEFSKGVAMGCSSCGKRRRQFAEMVSASSEPKVNVSRAPSTSKALNESDPRYQRQKLWEARQIRIAARQARIKARNERNERNERLARNSK